MAPRANGRCAHASRSRIPAPQCVGDDRGSRAGGAARARAHVCSTGDVVGLADHGAIPGSGTQDLGRVCNGSASSFLRRYRSIPRRRRPRLSAPARSHRMSPWIHPPWMNHVALRLGANNLHKRKKVFPHYLCCGARMRAPVGDPGTSLGENAYSRHEGKFSLAAGEHLYLSVRRGRCLAFARKLCVATPALPRVAGARYSLASTERCRQKLTFLPCLSAVRILARLISGNESKPSRVSAPSSRCQSTPG
jgi:hypothetical protein